MSKNKETNHSLSYMSEALDLCVAIQNTKIATVFFHLSGHINQCDIALHFPEWRSGDRADVNLTIDGSKGNIRDNLKTLEKLKAILNQAESVAEEIKASEKRKQEERRKRYLELKREFETTNP